ncbi:type II secretion system F family protein [Candidatus Woesearchaeota archaeon]|nr:type II secretion system F family protein [Candidatus Woesearchaeota archaeon]
MMNANIYRALFRPSPRLKKSIRTAHMNVDPRHFIKRNMVLALQFSLGFCVMMGFIFARYNVNLVILPGVFLLFFVGFYSFFMATPQVYIKRREREIEKDILFATRYLLIKIESGTPLFNAMIDASHSYGVAGKYFKEIVDDINLGKPIEKAIEDALRYNASHDFQLVLRQILNSLRTGVDVTDSLQKLLDEITRNHQIEIKAYSKKLNSIILFYLIIACVMPSLGIAMVTVFASLVNIQIDMPVLMSVLFFVTLVQATFISVIRSIRPAVDI